MPGTTEHWDAAYAAEGERGVSWYAPTAAPVLELLDRLDVPTSARVLDAGGGASPLVDGLVARGHRDVTVLDLSATALALARDRLGSRSANVEWIVADVRTWRPRSPFELWHDRAVLHFLVSSDDRAAYLETLASATRRESLVVLSTFAPDGPDRCSGLPVVRYSAADLAALLGADFELLEDDREQHITPWGTAQAFVRAAFRRR
ncbi:class I SAM-dependent methyltransferase [Sporichthya polymorpha]|uniref:class I SAM-dependent methyltransferase n=1 Tax=Sporichthya polymorpha TaxID=35751 RepID=UPI00036D66FC|nr:class I SAM-dependent methyltransferase [Sporichthya polymorpha]